MIFGIASFGVTASPYSECLKINNIHHFLKYRDVIEYKYSSLLEKNISDESLSKNYPWFAGKDMYQLKLFIDPRVCGTFEEESKLNAQLIDMFKGDDVHNCQSIKGAVTFTEEQRQNIEADGSDSHIKMTYDKITIDYSKITGNFGKKFTKKELKKFRKYMKPIEKYKFNNDPLNYCKIANKAINKIYRLKTKKNQ